jgi:hypothetical protein
MATSSAPSLLAYAYEGSTPGTGPADAAAWLTAVSSATTGGRLRHVATSLDVSGFKQGMFEDERSQVDILTQELKVKGIKGGTEFPFDFYLHGTGVTTADTSQVAATMTCNFLLHMMGGQSRTYSTTATGGTTTTVIVAATTGIDEGVYLGIQDTTSPAARDTGIVYIRRVLSWNNGTSTATLDEALPFAPANGDIVHGCEATYIDESVLVDSSAASDRTLSWLLQKGLTGALESWEARGCCSYITGIALNRNAAPVVSTQTMVASYETPEEAPDPSWVDDPVGFAPQAVGVRTSLWMETVGTTTSTQFNPISCTIAPGLERVPIETITEAQVGMPGRALYSLGKSDCMVDLHIVPFASTRFTEFNADTLKQIRYAKAAAPGSSWAVHFPRCQQVETPANQDAEAVLGQMLKYRAMQNTAISGGSNVALGRSRMVIIRA